MRDADILREAATRIHVLGLWLDLQADRIEVAGVDDDETRSAVAAAREMIEEES